MAKRVAVLLAGCGVFDGSEIHEASAVLVHLSREGAQAEVYAPNIPQMHVVDHVKGQPTAEQRNVLVESARIARGNIKDLATLDVKGLDALIIPGRAVWGLPATAWTFHRSGRVWELWDGEGQAGAGLGRRANFSSCLDSGLSHTSFMKNPFLRIFPPEKLRDLRNKM
uniref:GAL3A protein n=1 Tax=Junco hyemalis TaxID=40217 RepID=A0A8C5JE54_JUNHY